MTSKFFSRRIRFFGNIALVILCVIFFMVPFGFRGARMAVEGMRNDVKDWLPKDFPETVELRWFQQHFMHGEAFAVVTWPGCNEDDPTFDLLVKKLKAEVLHQNELDQPGLTEQERERIRAHQLGDQLGLHLMTDLYEDWGGQKEKWLKGDNNQWFYITPVGELYRWRGKSNMIGWMRRKAERSFTGENKLEGDLVAQWGTPSKPGKPNEFHADPRKLTARFFKSVSTGPDVLEQLAGEGGSLRPYGSDPSDAIAQESRRIAFDRLSGILFGPIVPQDFDWSLEQFKEFVPERRLKQLPRGWEPLYDAAITKLLDKHFNGNRAKLLAADAEEQEKFWNELFARLGTQAPDKFQWTLDDLESVLTDKQKQQLQDRWRTIFHDFVEQLVDGKYNADRKKLLAAPEAEQRLQWERLFSKLDYPAPNLITWDLLTFEAGLSKTARRELDESWRRIYQEAVEEVVALYYEGDRAKLLGAPRSEQQPHWASVLGQISLTPNGAPPARQTCILVTLSEPGLRDFSRALGRELMGKPKGRIRALAIDECGIDEEDLRLGGPPVDNVAIDEEGKITLARLVSFSALVGLVLAFFCFRSVKVTIMVFFVGGVSAATSLGIVWWCGSSVDAILMSMPSLVYVLGLSGAIHIVNYYRDAAQEHGVHGAPETAISHGWFPCTLAAFTTSLGLISLYLGSNVVPIQKFGLFAAIGTMATVILLFTFLPSALQVWPPGYHRRRQNTDGDQSAGLVSRFWATVGRFVIRRHWWVSGACFAVFAFFMFGLPKIQTSVHLLKLFDGDAKIIRDYTWLEDHLGKLVPMELVVCVDESLQRPTLSELEQMPPDERDTERESMQLNFLERAEIASRVQRVVEREFGGKHDVVGQGMSSCTLVPELPAADADYVTRLGFNGQLERNRQELISQDYLAMEAAGKNHPDEFQPGGRELWRISLRLGALNDVDYGEFIHEVRRAVEPVLSAYRFRTEALKHIWDETRDEGGKSQSLLVLGRPQPPTSKDATTQVAATATDGFRIDQTAIFTDTLQDLFTNRNFRSPTRKSPRPKKRVDWHTPEALPLDQVAKDKEQLGKLLSGYDCVVLIRDHDSYDIPFIREHAKHFVDARDHMYDPHSPHALTAAERFADGDENSAVAVTYTGIVPIVYKAQRTLLDSLINSIGLAFVMIAGVMMVLLRDWRSRFSVKNSLNFAGGLASMIPNVFPVVIIFGAMGYGGVLVDIGMMMTASVAMGVAVDDTIHFLNWYRYGLREGKSRHEAIALAYDRCATAMTQTTLIGGLGLAVFALSTFTPTQTFGIMMLLLLLAALVGDLIFLPALLAGPLGRFFGKQPTQLVTDQGAITVDKPDQPEEGESGLCNADNPARSETPHSAGARQTDTERFRRADSSHSQPSQK